MIKPIRDENDLNATLERISELWGAAIGTPQGDELEILTILVQRYEDAHHAIPPSDPIKAIKFMMAQKGLQQKDLVPFIGSPSKISEVLNHKRPLSMAMVKRLHNGLAIPYDCLLN